MVEPPSRNTAKPTDPFDQCLGEVLAKLEAGSGIVAPMVRRGVETTVRYFHDEIGIGFHDIKTTWIEYIKGIDFHYPVTIIELHAGTKMVQYRPPDARNKPFVYYTKPGTSQMNLGISFHEYRFREVHLRQQASALKSRASDLGWKKLGHWDGISRPGGGTQYILPSRVHTKVVYESGMVGPRSVGPRDQWTTERWMPQDH